MGKKLIKLNTSYALVIDKALLNQLKIGPDTEVDLILEDHNRALRIQRSILPQELREQAVRHAKEKMEMKHMINAIRVMGGKKPLK